METLEGNKLIAEFIGWDAHEDSSWDAHEMSNLKYHSSWDWLHSAWEKFRSMKLEGDGFDHTYMNHLEAISNSIANLSIETAFQRLANGIQWYNQQPTTHA